MSDEQDLETIAAWLALEDPMPEHVDLLLVFGGQAGWQDKAGSGNVAAYILVSMALYGAALTAAAGGSMVALERSLGWSRQLRLTPLNPVAYILMKAVVALGTREMVSPVGALGVLRARLATPPKVRLPPGPKSV